MDSDRPPRTPPSLPLPPPPPKLLLLPLVILALTGFVCTHKIQAEEECLSSTVLCYECDSRHDPNCADPFNFTSLEPPVGQPAREADADLAADARQAHGSHQPNATAASTGLAKRKKLPPVSVCHGCCVKITSRLPDGVSYVKRTCTSNLQINYFMVGLVCMKESGDKGKMCFCEVDYCNGQAPRGSSLAALVLVGLSTISLARYYR